MLRVSYNPKHNLSIGAGDYATGYFLHEESRPIGHEGLQIVVSQWCSIQLNEGYSYETVPALLGRSLNGEWFASSQNGSTNFTIAVRTRQAGDVDVPAIDG